jgi:hypothetical protein
MGLSLNFNAAIIGGNYEQLLHWTAERKYLNFLKDCLTGIDLPSMMSIDRI